MLYDYYGFPAEAYNVKYDASGSPEVARLVQDTLREGGVEANLDEKRGEYEMSNFNPHRSVCIYPPSNDITDEIMNSSGWDHGVFVPLLRIHPTANTPIVQVSLTASTSAAEHYRVGKALAPLLEHNIAILGSGMPSFHNLRLMFSGAVQSDPGVRVRGDAWSAKLTQVLGLQDEHAALAEWEAWRSWVGAAEAHPLGGEEHLWPVIVCAGAAAAAAARTDEAKRVTGKEDQEWKMKWWGDEVSGLEQRSYWWADEEV